MEPDRLQKITRWSRQVVRLMGLGLVLTLAGQLVLQTALDGPQSSIARFAAMTVRGGLILIAATLVIAAVIVVIRDTRMLWHERGLGRSEALYPLKLDTFFAAFMVVIPVLWITNMIRDF